jgi:Mg2+ and Co2+ transporters
VTRRRSTELRDHATRNPKILGEGPVALLHRIVDGMVDSYRPEMDKLEDRIDDLEKQIFDRPDPSLVRRILDEKRQIAGLRRIVTPQRDVVARLARRDFVDISTEMSFRFRDVYDHLVRVADDVLIFQDRITGMLDAHLSNVSNRLNEVMKVLTVVSTVLMPLTLLTSLYGMNVPLPQFPGGEREQFWWLFGIMVVTAAAMLAMFRRRRWI